MPEMSIEESLFVGRWPKRSLGGIDWKSIRDRTLQLLKQEGLHFDPETKLKELSISNLQMLEILKAISRDADIIIMDEPTSSITNKEIEILFHKIADLRARGKAIVYISHKMDEVFQIADEISVLRDGKVVETRPKDQFDINSVIALMVGAPSGKAIRKKSFLTGTWFWKWSTSAGPADSTILQRERGRNRRLRRSFGAGRTETVRALFGLDEHTHGVIKVRGKPYKLKSVQDSIEVAASSCFPKTGDASASFPSETSKKMWRWRRWSSSSRTVISARPKREIRSRKKCAANQCQDGVY